MSHELIELMKKVEKLDEDGLSVTGLAGGVDKVEDILDGRSATIVIRIAGGAGLDAEMSDCVDYYEIEADPTDVEVKQRKPPVDYDPRDGMGEDIQTRVALQDMKDRQEDLADQKGVEFSVAGIRNRDGRKFKVRD